MTETVLFDAGGVLLDLDYPFLGRLLRARGRQVTTEQLARAEAIARREIHRKLTDHGGRAGELWRDYFHILLHEVGTPVELHEETIDTLWEGHLRFGLWNVAVDGAVGTVRRLRSAGLGIGVVSNAEGRVEQDLDAAGFAGLFETVVDSHVVGVEKPDPAIFRIALERMGARAETTVFLGDVPAIDVAGARSAGIQPLLLDRHDLYPDPDVPRLSAITGLPQWLGLEPADAGSDPS